ncbi:MAG TPA: hypothetical protein VGI20_01595 [Rhizomicrobium sp.]|jgi:hypothetical protein
MIRILNFFCFASAALCCLALYHVSEQTRIARIHLSAVERQIADEHDAMKVLQADWERVSEPSHIQALAQTKIGLSDTPAVALASLEALPRRGETPAASPVQTASISVVPNSVDPHLHLAAAHAGN